jgi:hypothetical protein
MSIGSVLLGLGVLLFVVFLLRLVIRRRGAVRIGSVTGNVFVGDNAGSVNQTANVSTPPEPAKSEIGWIDRVLIVIGLFVAALGVYLDHFAK